MVVLISPHSFRVVAIINHSCKNKLLWQENLSNKSNLLNGLNSDDLYSHKVNAKLSFPSLPLLFRLRCLFLSS